jgi:hypothetical protein
MKKILITAFIATTTIATQAQDNQASSPDQPKIIRMVDSRGIFEVFGTIALAAAIMFTILTILRRVMDYRLKNKLIDKGISDTAISSILQVDPNENKNLNIKWFALLAGIGIALTIIYYTLPLGIHSLAIMAFSLSASFLGYYFFLQRSGK